MLRAHSPIGVEVQLSNQLECVYGPNVEITTHVRQLSVSPGSAWLGMLGGYHTPSLYINESISDQERVASHLYNFLVGQVTGIPPLGDAGNQVYVSLFI